MLSRRRFLVQGGAAVGGVALLGSCAAQTAKAFVADGTAGLDATRYVEFFGPHQTGISAVPVPARALMASFTVTAADRTALRSMLRELTQEIEGLMSGRPPDVRDATYPPTDSGILGPEPAPAGLSVVVSVGASLFDDRFGLSGLRPAQLREMPFLANDRLDPGRSHGDLLIAVEAEHDDVLVFALRQLMRRTRRELVLRWVLDGYTRSTRPSADTDGAHRNLMGFKDGTANLIPARENLDRYVWVAPGDDEPEWAVGGSYQVVRVIRMFVEFWDRTPLAEQEAIFGRHKNTGAPLGLERESDAPDYDADPDGIAIPLDAHIRLANPRTPETEDSLIFRRGFSYTRGYDGSGRLDQGLAFVSYQRDLRKGFLAVQARLTGEPLEEYILPEGGGFFYALPGVPDSSRYLGDALVG